MRGEETIVIVFTNDNSIHHSVKPVEIISVGDGKTTSIQTPLKLNNNYWQFSEAVAIGGIEMWINQST